MKQFKSAAAAVVFLLSVLALCAGCGGANNSEIVFSDARSEAPDGEISGTEGGEAKVGDAMKAQDTASDDNGSETQTVFVHVCGAVNAPGVYELAENARIYEAVAAAGGCSADASADSLNLAQSVSDGMRIYVPTVSEAAKASEEWTPKSAAGTDSALVNLNTASKEELMTLPGIGESKAESIISYREQNGAFQSIEDIMQISGIKNSIFDRIRDKITV